MHSFIIPVHLFLAYNDLALTRRQAIILASDGVVYWRIYASLGMGIWWPELIVHLSYTLLQ